MKLAKKLGAVTLASMMAVTSAPAVMAEEVVAVEVLNEVPEVTQEVEVLAEGPQEEATPFEITGYVEVAAFSVAFGTAKDDVLAKLPDTLTANTADEEKTAEVPVTWECGTYNGKTAAEYTYTGTIGDLPEGFVDAEDTKATVTVKVTVNTATKAQVQDLAQDIQKAYKEADYTAFSYKKVVKDNIAKIDEENSYDTLFVTLKNILDNKTDGEETLVDITEFKQYVASIKDKDLKEEEYTKTSWKAYEQAMSDANDVLAQVVLPSVAVTESALSTAKDNLDTAVYPKKDSNGDLTNDVTGLISIVELKDLVDEYKDVKANSGDYKESTELRNFLKAYDTAEKVLNNENPADADTPKEVKDLAETLKDNASKLVKVNGSTLKALIEKAEDIVNNHSDYFDTKHADWTTFKNALQNAKTVLGNADTVNLETAITTLQNALEGIKDNTVVEEERNALMDLVTEGEDENKKFIDTSKLDESDYLYFEKYVEAVKAGQDLLENVAYPTAEELTAKAEAITDNNAQTTKENLEGLIETVTGEDTPYLKANYTEESYKVLTSAVSDANAILEQVGDDVDTKIERTAVKSAYLKLEAAIKGLEAVNADKTALSKLVESVKDYTKDGFNDAEWNAFSKALEKAKEVLNSTNATEKQITDAYQALSEAKAELDKVGITAETLQAKIDEANALVETDYTPASWLDLQQAIEKAEKAIASAKQEDIKKAQLDLVAKMDALVSANSKATLVSTYNRIRTAYTVETKYTVQSWAKLDEAKKAVITATKVKDDTVELTSTHVDKLANSKCTQLEKALLEAEKGLVEVSMTELKALVKEANKKEEKAYTAESWKTFAEALEVAKEVIENVGTASEIRVAQGNLQVAMDALVEAEKVELKAASNLDVPEMVSVRNYVFSGWAAANNEIATVKVNIDGQYVADAALYERAGLAEALPEYSSVTGVALAFDTYNLTDGAHELTLTIIDKDGAEVTTAAQSVYINNPIGCVDTPVANSTVSDDLILVSGWFGSVDGIESVDLLIGDEVIGSAYTYERAGLAEALPSTYNVENGGFAVNIAKANLVAGTYTITVKATTTKGAVVTRDVTFTIA